MATPSDNVFAPPKSPVLDAPRGDVIEKASRGIRLAAKMIDGLALTIGLWPSYWAALPLLEKQIVPGTPPTTLQVWSILAQTGSPFYVGVAVMLVSIAVDALWVAQRGQTIGKRLCNIRIVRTDGSRAHFWRIFGLRYLVTALVTLFLPIAGRLYAVVDVCFIFGAPRRCIHDWIADTIVVRA